MIEIDYNLANVEPQCPFCNGSRKIYIYRADWENFDEINCENCNKPL